MTKEKKRQDFFLPFGVQKEPIDSSVMSEVLAAVQRD